MTSERTAADDPAVEAAASDVWRLMAEFTWSRMQRGQAFHALKSLGLTPGHLRVLQALEPDEAISMGSIADVLQCDPSMATWLIDRLEERKLVERKMLTTDRRVKIVSLTRRGVRVKTKVLAHLLEPPPELLTLGMERLEALRGALSALPPSERRHAHGRGEGRHGASRVPGVGTS